MTPDDVRPADYRHWLEQYQQAGRELDEIKELLRKAEAKRKRILAITAGLLSCLRPECSFESCLKEVES